MDQTARICMILQERHRQRRSLVVAELRLTLQIKAICFRFAKGDVTDAAKLYSSLRRGQDHALSLPALASTGVLLEARQLIATCRKKIDGELVMHARSLPIWPRVEATFGFGALTFASLIGETGDLRNYPTHSKVWKRLGIAVIDGERQRRIKGALALKHGYNPARRAVVWHVGQCLLRAQSARVGRDGQVIRPAGNYRRGYDARKALELTRASSRSHAHNRATRYMEKKLVRNLWRAWNAAGPFGCGAERSQPA